MPDLEWLAQEFSYGYDSGNVLSPLPDPVRADEERKIGGSYREVFYKAAFPFLRPDSVVLELGPGRGSWSRAILEHIPQGKLVTVDLQDVAQWLEPQRYGGRLVCHQVKDNSFSVLEDGAFDFFWSFGVMCHLTISQIKEVLTNTFRKMKQGGVAVHHYGDWQKLDAYGWERGSVPTEFQKMPDESIWWPRNSQRSMFQASREAGWQVIYTDLGLVSRDSISLLKKW